MKKLFCIVGRTASGKDTLAREVAKQSGLKILISYTTRPKRFPHEDTHVFVTEQNYQTDKENNQIIAYTEINGNKYWCTKEQLAQSDIYIIDPQGLETLKANNNDIDFVTIYIYADEDKRRKRFCMREPYGSALFAARNTSENMQFESFEYTKAYDYIVTNDIFSQAAKELMEIINKEK